MANDFQLQGLSAAEQMKKIFGKLMGNTAAKVERALRKMDEKKLKRLKRRKEWHELLTSKLPDEYEDPGDLANIKNAEDTIGDFKLKTSNDYVVPEDQRMNVYKAVERLMSIKRFVSLSLLTSGYRFVQLSSNLTCLTGLAQQLANDLQQQVASTAQQEEGLDRRNQRDDQSNGTDQIHAQHSM